jgi:PAS domain S-box-containing protein
MKYKNTCVPDDAEARIQKQFGLFSKISELNQQQWTVPELLDQVVNLIPAGWPTSDHITASVEFDGQTYKTTTCKKTEWFLSTHTRVCGEFTINIHVFFPDDHIFSLNRFFISGQQKLLKAIAVHTAEKIEKIYSEKDFQQKQELLDKAYRLARIGTWEYNMINGDLYWSDITKEVHGFGPGYQPDVESTILLFKEGYHRKIFEKAAMNAIENEQPFDVELKIVSGKGDERWIRATGEPDYKDGKCVRFYGISQNVTSRKKAEEDLQLSEQRFRALVQDGSDMIAILDEEANYQYVSPSSLTVLGISPETFIGRNAFDFIHEADKERLYEVLNRLTSEKRINIEPYRFTDAHGNWRWLETSITNMLEDPAVEGLVANTRDITERKQQQKQLLDSLKEKETLLAEIHHRVKNNLAVVAGLLGLQSLNEQKKEVKDSLNDCINRIQTISTIHELLYQSESFSKLNFSDNIRLLVTGILDTFKGKTDIDVLFNCDTIQLNIKQAIPCSLILNEVLTNILKHAFPGRLEGLIEVSLEKDTENNSITIAIKDNGAGLPEHFNPESSGSMGMTLINLLSQQIDARYNYTNLEYGTLFTITFKEGD